MGFTWAESFGAYLLTSGRSQETVRTYVASVHIFNVWAHCHEVDVDCANRSAIEIFLTEQMSQSLSRYTIRNRLLALRSYYDCLIAHEVRADNPTAGLHVKRPRTLPKAPVPLKDMRRLVYSLLNPRDQAQMLLFISTGIRLGELASIKCENIRWSEGLILIDGKGDKQRLVAPGEETLELLRQVVGNKARGPVWFTKDGEPESKKRIRQNFYRHSRRLGLTVHPHQLRATFANVFLQEGGDVGALQSAMGHSNVTQTLHYAAGSQMERGLKQMREINIAGKVL